MRLKLLIFSLFICFSLTSIAQEACKLGGLVSSEEGVPIINAKISIGAESAFTDSDGRFQLTMPCVEEKVRLVIQGYGYETLDSMMVFSGQRQFLDFELQALAYGAPVVEIVDQAQDQFTRKDWRILDFVADSRGLFILNYKNGERFLTHVNKAGRQVMEVAMPIKANALHYSCSQKIHIVGDEECAEMRADGHAVLQVYDRSIFDRLIAPCVVKVDAQPIFKNLSRHNKLAKYFVYNNPKDQKLLAHVYDRAAARVAHSYYVDIMRHYYSAVDGQDEQSIHYGIELDNIVAKGEWNGNLVDLIEDNAGMAAVSYYKNVEAKPVAVQEFLVDNALVIFDRSSSSIYKIQPQGPEVDTIKVTTEIDWASGQLVQDRSSGHLYLLQNNATLYQMDLNKANQLSLQKMTAVDLAGSLPSDVQIVDDMLYYYAFEGQELPITKMHKLKLVAEG